MEIRLMIACARADDATRIAHALAPHALHEVSIALRPVALEYACAVAQATQPDVALVEMDAAPLVLPRLARASGGTRALLLYRVCSRADVIEAIRLGAFGCIAWPIDPQLLAKAVRTLFMGATWFGRTALLQALRSQIGIDPPVQADAGKLTPREEEILRLIGLGLSNKEIGRRLDISSHTVKTHLHRAYSKLHQSGRYKAYLAL